MITAVIDRFEGNKAVLLVGEREEKVVLPRRYLHDYLHEGDYITISVNYDEAATLAARQEAEALLEKVRK